MVKNHEDTFLSVAQDHARIVNRAVKEMALCVEAWTEGNEEEMARKLELVNKLERDADGIKKKIIKMVAEAQTSLSRTDMLRMILQIDELADYAEGTAVRITRVKYRPREKIAEEVNALARGVVKSARIMRQALSELMNNPEKVMRRCEELDAAEREVDELFRDLETNLFDDLSMDVRILLQIRSVAYHMEDMGDIAMRVGDAIRIFACTR
ncbi:MAG: DUF47 domain-containing protein [Promethearchaeota archaeon]